jgi:hypothetical protein
MSFESAVHVDLCVANIVSVTQSRRIVSPQPCIATFAITSDKRTFIGIGEDATQQQVKPQAFTKKMTNVNVNAKTADFPEIALCKILH